MQKPRKKQIISSLKIGCLFEYFIRNAGSGHYYTITDTVLY